MYSKTVIPMMGRQLIPSPSLSQSTVRLRFSCGSCAMEKQWSQVRIRASWMASSQRWATRTHNTLAIDSWHRSLLV